MRISNLVMCSTIWLILDEDLRIAFTFTRKGHFYPSTQLEVQRVQCLNFIQARFHVLTSSQSRSFSVTVSPLVGLGTNVLGKLKEGTMFVSEFVRLTRVGGSPSNIGRLRIDEIQFRQCKRLPFRHEYVIAFVHQDRIDWVIRLER